MSAGPWWAEDGPLAVTGEGVVFRVVRDRDGDVMAVARLGSIEDQETAWDVEPGDWGHFERLERRWREGDDAGALKEELRGHYYGGLA